MMRRAKIGKVFRQAYKRNNGRSIHVDNNMELPNLYNSRLITRKNTSMIDLVTKELVLILSGIFIISLILNKKGLL